MNLEYVYVDTQLGARYTLAFHAKEETLQKRLRAPWVIGRYQGAYRMGQFATLEPNLFVVFNDLMLNLQTDGSPKPDQAPRYVGFNIPVANPETSETGMMHFRNYCGDQGQSPGHYADSVFAPTTWDEHIVGSGINSTITFHARFEPETGGKVEIDLTYRRSLPRLVESRAPEFFVWAAHDPTILRVYQDYGLAEMIWLHDVNLNHVDHLEFHVETPEMQDLFDGSEQLISVVSNPIYTRKVFVPQAWLAALQNPAAAHN